jgi:D-alanyl-D-alanine carboxypeptidase
MPLTRFPLRKLVTAGLGLGTLLATWAAAPLPAMAQPMPAGAFAGPHSTGTSSPSATSADTALDRTALKALLAAVHDAGMYGTYSTVRDGGAEWRGAAGVADVRTGRPVRPGMLHRIGSVSKAFTSVALLQQVERGRLELDAPIGRYLPDLVPGERGQKVTVRMLLNHTSGIGDYVFGAFPSLAQASPASIDDNRFKKFRPEELVRLGLAAPATGEPGQRWSYSNTNYVIAGLLLAKLTGTGAEDYITRNVIRKAGLSDTSYPRTPFILGPHSKAYEALYGFIDPPRDYSVYDMSWAYTAGAVVSTMEDVNTFYRELLGGRLLGARALAEMLRTVPATDAQGNVLFQYGLGVYAQDLPCGRFWGHDGAVWGSGTITLSSPDGRRQVSIGINLMKYQHLDENGAVQVHPIDIALSDYLLRALCGTQAAPPSTLSSPSIRLFPADSLWATVR